MASGCNQCDVERRSNQHELRFAQVPAMDVERHDQHRNHLIVAGEDFQNRLHIREHVDQRKRPPTLRQDRRGGLGLTQASSVALRWRRSVPLTPLQSE